MTEEQKALIRAQYELLVELFDSQGDGALLKVTWDVTQGTVPVRAK